MTMTMTIQEMPKAQFERTLDKALARFSAACTALIAAGYGHERPAETRARAALTACPFAVEWAAASDAVLVLHEEREARLRYHGTLHSIYRKKTWHLGVKPKRR
jgi:hypothetical protein